MSAMNPKRENSLPGHAVTRDTGDATAISTHHGRTILMLEDDDAFSEILAAYFSSYGFEVVRVPSGAEGLKKILAVDFDVIICDMVMPGFPGDMFYLAVSRTKPHLLRRFIFMTGYQGDKKIDEFIRRIRGVVLWKPFQFREMMERIEVVLSRSAMSAGLRAA
jgi:DNA-binding response OmpR family regulator